MLPMIFEQTLNDLVARSPFSPFSVELVNGRAIEVDHPEALAYRASHAIFIGKDGRLHHFDPDGVNRIIAPGENGST